MFKHLLKKHDWNSYSGDRYGNDVDDDGGYGDKDDRNDNDQDNAEVNVRSKRGIRGTYRESSNKNSKSYRQVFKHRTQTGPEGRVSVDTQHHHERAGAQEQSNKAGSFGFAKTGDNG